MASMTRCASMCSGSGSCTRMPLIASSPLSSSMSVEQLALLHAAGSLCSKLRMPTSTVCRALVAHVDLAGRILPDEHHGQAGLQVVLCLEARDLIGDRGAQGSCVGLAVDDVSGHGMKSSGIEQVGVATAVGMGHAAARCHDVAEQRQSGGQNDGQNGGRSGAGNRKKRASNRGTGPSRNGPIEEWCRREDSNLRPTHYECVALPAELRRPRPKKHSNQKPACLFGNLP
jgi:hypothetical protein